MVGPGLRVRSVRDNVEAVHRLLTEDLGITHLRTIIGFSMGAQQAFQWAVSYPTFADRIVATSGTAKTYGHGIVRLEGQLAALMADPAFNNGDYTSPPANGLAAFGTVWAAWLYSQEWWRRELWKGAAPPGTTLDQFIRAWPQRFPGNNDANNLVLQVRTWERHDIGQTPGFDGDVEKALGAIRVPFLYMPSETDLYFALTDAKYEQQFMKTVVFVPIPSIWGHPAGAGANPEDKAFLNTTIARFLTGQSVR